jgi:hypothetical protein
MPTQHPHPWHKCSIFGDGPRLPMCRERRAQWKARLEIHRRAGRITDGFSYVGLALIRRLGQDGRCDPSHQTLADDSGESLSTVKRALDAFRDCGLVFWVRRIIRDGWRAVQTSNAYLLSLGETPKIPVLACKAQSDRETLKQVSPILVAPITRVSEAEERAAIAALQRRAAVIQARLLTREVVSAARPRFDKPASELAETEELKCVSAEDRNVNRSLDTAEGKLFRDDILVERVSEVGVWSITMRQVFVSIVWHGLSV